MKAVSLFIIIILMIILKTEQIIYLPATLLIAVITLPLASITFNKIIKNARLNLFITYFGEKYNFYSPKTMQTVLNRIEDM